MAKKVRRRTVTSDDGDSIQFVAVVENHQVVNDDRNGVIVTDADGDELVIPFSATAMRNTANWFNAA